MSPPRSSLPSPAPAGFFLVLLAAGVVALLTCVKPGASATCPAPTDYIGRIGSPSRYDAALDVYPYAAPDGRLTIQDLTTAILRLGPCAPTPSPSPAGASVRFLSKLTDADSQYRANPSAFAAMMNANYEAVMTFDCGICREFGNAFDGPVFVYQDPTKILTDCSGEQPGTDCSDILLTTTGQQCWQQYFNGSRYLADVTQADVRDEIVNKAKALESETAFDAIYIDVAEAYLPNAADCPGAPAVSNAQWLSGWANLAERLQAEVPGPLLLNTQYVTWNSLWNTDPVAADRFFAAPDAIEIEFGWPYGRHGEETASGAAQKLAAIDRVHALGTAIFDQDYADGNADFPTQLRDFGLAMYFIEWAPGDFYGTFNQDGHGSAFWPGYNKDLGAPLGGRQSCGSGCYYRDFAAGRVTANVNTKTGAVP